MGPPGRLRVQDCLRAVRRRPPIPHPSPRAVKPDQRGDVRRQAANGTSQRHVKRVSWGVGSFECRRIGPSGRRRVHTPPPHASVRGDCHTPAAVQYTRVLATGRPCLLFALFCQVPVPEPTHNPTIVSPPPPGTSVLSSEHYCPFTVDPRAHSWGSMGSPRALSSIRSQLER